jgi:hypothetical protein
LPLTAVRRKAAAALLGLGLLAAASPGFGATPNALPQKVTGPEISMLIRATVVALHQANLTGNYSVLHDLGDSQFQAAYNQATLSDMFRGFRDRHINLEPAILYDSDLDAPPKLTTDGLLRVVGHFATAPEQVVFDITFHNQGGIWRLNSLNAGTRPVPLAAASPQPQPTGQPVMQPVAAHAPVPLAAPLARAAAPVRRAAPQIGVVDVGNAAAGFE